MQFPFLSVQLNDEYLLALFVHDIIVLIVAAIKEVFSGEE